MSTGAVSESDAPDDTFDDYRRERFEEARAAGLSLAQSRRFANGQVPLRTLRKARGKCDLETLARLVC